MRDVTIFGAGAFGLAIAWACRARGASVRVIDPNGVGQRASNGLVGALAPHVPENWNDKKEIQFQSLDIAEAFWRETAQIAGRDPGYARLGRIQPLMDDRAVALARARAETARDLWKGRYAWRVIPAEDAGIPVVSPTGLVIFDTLTARMHPRHATATLAEALRRKGAEIVTDGAAEGRVIHATGVAGLLELNGLAGQKIIGSAVKGQAALLDADLRGRPQLFADAVHIVPHADGTTAIGSTSERAFDAPDTTDDQLDAVIAKARAACPALAEAPVIKRWAGLRPRARSRAPMLGPHPLHEGQYIANGGFKIGFGIAPIVAQMMADLVLDGRDTIPDLFKPDASMR
ncbi:Oxidoreductase, FAD-binding protein [Roseibacterium elongatum DSM 19469]|uniref:Oxidoreductase, FAD-binding protein n=1 Tax=Roseicyclus elongatus DSM 19469 TaxID=1294273 RepID=W8RRC2_9RHOB|nr:FAD-dependent oxidoreductase [Roseibacterium elongatum]AHM03633.1 Oxidoreductase, FAD-binding protein [Roseibacterium elongatum DSM 19469]